MTTLRASQVRRALQRKGADADESHHTMFRKVVGGELRALTRLSHGTSEIGDWHIAQMSKQCHLSKRQFLDLVDCSLSAAEWEAILLQPR